MLDEIKLICNQTGLTVRAGYSGASKTNFASFHTNDKDPRTICSGHGDSVKSSLKMLVNVFNEYNSKEFNLIEK